MTDAPGPLIAFYGDDFTGSTDVLEALARSGLRAALFLDAPSPERLAGRFAGLHAVGVAGLSRSMTPAQMDAALPPIFEALGRLGPRIVHYKICSTFDSSAEIGSIGRAIEIGSRIFDPPFVPLVVGATILRRYCLFGNLFAAHGPATVRLDRHPTMSRHPVTPMDEADLREVLARQTDIPVILMDLLDLDGPDLDVDQRFRGLLGRGETVLLFDVLDDRRLAVAGRLIWSEAQGVRPLFAVGSSGLEYALTAHWRDAGLLPEPAPFPALGPVDTLLVVSGSCSPTTREQVRWAVDHDFAFVEVDAEAMTDRDRAEPAIAGAMRRASSALSEHRGVILGTALGPDDPRIAATMERSAGRGMSPGEARERIGEGLGLCLRGVLEAVPLRRVVVAGGDTSGHVARQLGIEALEVIRPTAPGSPMCRVMASRPSVDGLEIVLKGGQVGPRDFFGTILGGLL